MPQPNQWKQEYSGRDRVQMVVETLDEPATVTQIADEANVAWGTADSELERLQAENRVREHTVDGNTLFAPNPVQLLLDEILDRIDEHDRDELESTLVEHQSRLESIQAEYDAETLTQLREKIADEDLSAAEMRDIRNVVSTWEALETEIRLSKHALRLYDDVSQLSDTGSGDGLVSV